MDFINKMKDQVSNNFSKSVDEIKDSVLNNLSEIFDSIKETDFSGAIDSSKETVKRIVPGTIDQLKQKGDQIAENINTAISQTDFDPLLDALYDACYGGLIGFAIIPGILLFLCLLGFTCCGVVGGSLAACRQSQIGLVPARSLFSLCQKISMNPITYYLIPVFGLIGFIAGLVYHFV